MHILLTTYTVSQYVKIPKHNVFEIYNILGNTEIISKLLKISLRPQSVGGGEQLRQTCLQYHFTNQNFTM